MLLFLQKNFLNQLLSPQCAKWRKRQRNSAHSNRFPTISELIRLAKNRTYTVFKNLEIFTESKQRMSSINYDFPAVIPESPKLDFGIRWRLSGVYFMPACHIVALRIVFLTSKYLPSFRETLTLTGIMA